MKMFTLLTSLIIVLFASLSTANASTETYRSGRDRVTLSGNTAVGVMAGTMIGCDYIGRSGNQEKWTCNSNVYQLVLETDNNSQVASLGLFYNRAGRYVSTMHVPYSQVRVTR